MRDEYLTTQIITYMGNKRKLLPNIELVVNDVCKKLKKNNLVCADAFSGSGIVSRLLKKYSSRLYVNDIAGYSETLNKCYLMSPTDNEIKSITKYVKQANDYVNQDEECESYVEKHWGSKKRAYFTTENGRLIDKYRTYINNIPEKYRSFLLANLLVKCSIHNNTNGHFSAYYKDEKGEGKYGGKNEIDINRITKRIQLDIPVFYRNDCKVEISRMDTNAWIKKIPELDLVYIDPPYNKHPYSIYYFMLDIINDWDINTDIPDTTRGQPLGWDRSNYNSFKHAEAAFEELIKGLRSKFIIVSYNNKGIIPVEKIEKILERKGQVQRYDISHGVYGRLEGIGDYKREKLKEKTNEYLWLIDTR